MKYLTVLLFAFSSSFGQISIKNTAFIFADDKPIYVENDINLIDVNSNIYLRNEAQLIQGLGTTGNSGIGNLSTQQNGTVDQYAYNYWCSPVGNSDITDNNNRNFRVDQIDESIGLIGSNDVAFTNAYDGISSPLTISRLWLWKFVAGSQFSDWDYAGPSGAIAPGLGFTMKGTNGSGSNQLYDFRGKPNNGTISNTVIAGNQTLIGNPYPSALDAVDFIHDTQNVNAITGTLFFWEHDPNANSHFLVNYVGGYATYTISADGSVETFIPSTFDTYNGDGSLNTTGASSSNGKQVKRYIPIGQGFMVEGKTGTTGTVRTTNDHREYYKQSNTESEFFRTSNRTDPNVFPRIPNWCKRFRLNIDFNDTYTKQLVQTFHPSASIGFDYGLEIKFPEGIELREVHWSIDSKPYAAEARVFDLNTKIPLTINLEEQKSIRIRLSDLQNFDSGLPIYIHDKYQGLYYNLRSLNFQLTLDEGIYNDRFEITFKSNDQDDDIDTTSLGFQGKLRVFQNNDLSQLIILNPYKTTVNSIKIYNTSGKEVLFKSNLVVKSRYNISTEFLSQGVYFVDMLLGNGDHKIIRKKILIN